MKPITDSEFSRHVAAIQRRAERRETLRLMWPFYGYGLCMYGLGLLTMWAMLREGVR